MTPDLSDSCTGGVSCTRVYVLKAPPKTHDCKGRSKDRYKKEALFLDILLAVAYLTSRSISVGWLIDVLIAFSWACLSLCRFLLTMCECIGVCVLEGSPDVKGTVYFEKAVSNGLVDG